MAKAKLDSFVVLNFGQSAVINSDYRTESEQVKPSYRVRCDFTYRGQEYKNQCFNLKWSCMYNQLTNEKEPYLYVDYFPYALQGTSDICKALIREAVQEYVANQIQNTEEIGIRDALQASYNNKMQAIQSDIEKLQDHLDALKEIGLNLKKAVFENHALTISHRVVCLITDKH